MHVSSSRDLDNRLYRVRAEFSECEIFANSAAAIREEIIMGIAREVTARVMERLGPAIDEAMKAVQIERIEQVDPPQKIQ